MSPSPYDHVSMLASTAVDLQRVDSEGLRYNNGGFRANDNLTSPSGMAVDTWTTARPLYFPRTPSYRLDPPLPYCDKFVTSCSMQNESRSFAALMFAREQLRVPPRRGARDTYCTMMPSKVLARAAATFWLMAMLLDGQASSAAGALDAGGEECRIVPQLPSHVQLNNGVSSESRPYTRCWFRCTAIEISLVPSPFFLSPLFGLVVLITGEVHVSLPITPIAEHLPYFGRLYVVVSSLSLR